MNLKFYTNVAKGLKQRVTKFLCLIHAFVEVTREKLIGGKGAFCKPPCPAPTSYHPEYYIRIISDRGTNR